MRSRVPSAFIAALVLGASMPAAGAPPPVLTDPRGALDAVSGAPAAAPVNSAAAPEDRIAAGLRAAEIELLAGAPARAEATLDGLAPTTPDDAGRKARLLLDAALERGDPHQAAERAAALERYPGWAQHARRAGARIEALERSSTVGGFGTILFALAIAACTVVGSRELLRPRLEVLAFGGVLLVALALAAGRPPPYPTAVGLFGVACLALVHGAGSALRRAIPSPRSRLFLVTVLLLGSFGAGVAVISRVDLEPLIAGFHF